MQPLPIAVGWADRLAPEPHYAVDRGRDDSPRRTTAGAGGEPELRPRSAARARPPRAERTQHEAGPRPRRRSTVDSLSAVAKGYSARPADLDTLLRRAVAMSCSRRL